VRSGLLPVQGLLQLMPARPGARIDHVTYLVAVFGRAARLGGGIVSGRFIRVSDGNQMGP
jgi:hypothetical protein